MRDNKYTIGEFSNKTGISIRTLRYYDEIGLLQPDKDAASGHRIYKYQDILTLQKIMSLKFLGYNLEKITHLLHETSFTIDFNETLSYHLQALEKEKEQIEQSISAIKRVIRLLAEEGEVECSVLFSLIHSMHTEEKQKGWMQHHQLSDVMDSISQKTEEEKIALDQTFIQLTKEVKQLYGKPVEDRNVQEMIKRYLEASFSFLGEDLMQKLAEADVEEMDIQELEEMAPSPFSEEEERWLNKAIEYLMKQSELE